MTRKQVLQGKLVRGISQKQEKYVKKRCQKENHYRKSNIQPIRVQKNKIIWNKEMYKR